MSTILPSYLLLAGAHIAAVAIVMAAVLRRDRGWLRAFAALAGTAAIWLPLLIRFHALGEANPNPPQKVMNLLGVFEEDKKIYLFVDTELGETAPRMYRVKQVTNKYDDGKYHVQQTGYSGLRGIRINIDDAGNYEPVYVDYEMPDWDKDAPPPESARLRSEN